MKINIETPNFVADVKLLDFLKKKMDKLELFYDRIIYADVFLKVQQTSEKENKIVEILLKVPGDDMIVKKQTRTFEQGVDECAQSLERQLKRRKEKLRAKAS